MEEICILSSILPVHACILHFAEEACGELYGDNALFQHTVSWLLCSSVSAVGMSKACCDAVPRIGENALAVFLIFSVYWKLGDRMSAQDVPNIGGLLFLWVTVPAYGAAAYTPVRCVTALLHVAVTRQQYTLQLQQLRAESYQGRPTHPYFCVTHCWLLCQDTVMCSTTRSRYSSWQQ